MKQTNKLTYLVIILIVACILTRLPQLLSPYLMLDSDECVTAVMAKHIIQKQDFSLFFWGQKYGLTIFESGIVSVFYLVLGVNTFAVKLAMLCFWTTGVLLLFKTFLLISNHDKHKSILLTLIFVCVPAWAVWSMKARGGYITSFVLSNLFLRIIFDKNLTNKTSVFFLLGIIFELIYESQPLWLIGICPLLFYTLKSPFQLRKIVLFALGLLITFLFFYTYKTSILYPYSPPIFYPDLNKLTIYLCRFPAYLYQSFTGQYYFSRFQPANLFTAILSIATILLISCLIIKASILSIKRKGSEQLFILSTLFIWGFLLSTFFSPGMEGRYLLPVTQFSLISLSVLLKSHDFKRKHTTICGTFIFLGCISLFSFWDFQFESDKKKEVSDIVQYLKTNRIKYVFSVDCSYPWFLIFNSDETIIARMPYYAGRSIAICDTIDANWKKGEKVALLNFKYNMPESDENNVKTIGDYYIKLLPAKREIENQFQFNNP